MQFEYSIIVRKEAEVGHIYSIYSAIRRVFLFSRMTTNN